MVLMESACHCRASFSAHVRLQLPFGENPEWGGGAIFETKNNCSTRPWGRRALILVNGSCLMPV